MLRDVIAALSHKAFNSLSGGCIGGSYPLKSRDRRGARKDETLANAMHNPADRYLDILILHQPIDQYALGVPKAVEILDRFGLDKTVIDKLMKRFPRGKGEDDR